MEINKNRFNRGTNYGRGLLEHSLRELGCGRSILTDKNGVILCGNDVYDIATRLGKKVVTIETDGDVLVAVKRMDVDANEKIGKELALVDNLSQEKNLDWDADKLHESMEKDFSFDPRNWGGYECLVKELDLAQFFSESTDKQDKGTNNDIFKKENQLSLFDNSI